MSLILYIDTASSRLMLALGGKMGPLREWSAECESHRYHSAMLVPAIQDLLAREKAGVKDLAALAIHHGPGSFTGLRTGVATARTMAQFLEIPVYVFNAFELIAGERFLQGTRGSEPCEIYIDALRGRAYHAGLRWSGKGPDFTITPEITMLPETVISQISDGTAAGRSLLVSESIRHRFTGGQPEPIRDARFTPQCMQALLARYGNYFRREWPEVRPLYIQEPSITLPKRRPPIH